MFMRSQPKIHKLDLSINTQTLGSEPDCSMTSDHRRKFFRKPEPGVRQDSSRHKRNHCEVKAFVGFFSPNNQQFSEMVRERSEADLRKLLFRNVPGMETPGHGNSQRELADCKATSEHSLINLNKSLYHYRTDRRKPTEPTEKENTPCASSRKPVEISEKPQCRLTQNEQLKFDIERLRDENVELKSRLSLTKKQLLEKTLKKEASSEELESLYKKSLSRQKELTEELSSCKLKIVRLEAESRTKQEVVNYMERTIKSLGEKAEELTIRQRALTSRLQASQKELQEAHERLKNINRQLESANCRLWNAQQKNSEIDTLRQDLKRYSNMAQANKQLKQLNQQLTRKLERMVVVRDHQLFSLSSEQNL